MLVYVASSGKNDNTDTDEESIILEVSPHDPDYFIEFITLAVAEQPHQHAPGRMVEPCELSKDNDELSSPPAVMPSC